MKCSEDDIIRIYESESINADVLLKWSKLLNYHFFRIYTQHLILFAPPEKFGYKQSPQKKSAELHQFRKNIYTIEIIEFILEMIKNGRKTKQQVINDYNILKTTLYKWIEKYL